MKPPLWKSTGDGSRISKLPHNVLDRILTFLPIKEAARTSVLSSKWRYQWRSIPHLVFDADFATFPKPDEGNKVMLQIYKALLVHQGPIHRFELAIPGMDCYPQIDQLIPYLSTKSVKELTVLSTLTIFSSQDYFSEVLPSSVFSILDLNILKLQRYQFVVPPGSMVGFSKLTLLELKEVDIPDNYDFFGTLLPHCPLLEELRVFDCTSTIEPLFESASLKALFFHSCFKTICFKDTSRLSVLSVVDTGVYDPDMVALFAALPALKQLELGIELLLFLSNGHVPYKLPAASLTNLEVLEIPRLLLDSLPEARVLVCLIMSSPNLRRLTIVRLEEFSIHICHGDQVELDLARFVLATAPLLKTVFVKPTEGLPSEDAITYLVEMTQYKRISKEAEVKYMQLMSIDED
ncbi:F-box/FBD/LRR-repeat protein At1g13570 [Linum perenne]